MLLPRMIGKNINFWIIFFYFLDDAFKLTLDLMFPSYGYFYFMKLAVLIKIKKLLKKNQILNQNWIKISNFQKIINKYAKTNFHVTN